MSEDKALPAVQKAYDLTLWLLPRIERFPRAHKFTLGDRLQGSALDLTMALVEAGHARSKDRALYRADRCLDQLRILLRLARDIGILAPRQHEHASRLNAELGKMIGAWMRWSRDQRGRDPEAVPGGS